MSTSAASFCLGCGTSLAIGSYRRQLSSVATRHVVPVWREILSTVLERENLVVDEAEVLGDKIGFVCRKCLRSYESFKAVKEKLLQSASEALKYMPCKAKDATDRKRILEEEDGDLTIPAKRARMAHNLQEGSSPGVQVLVQYANQRRNYVLTPSRKRIGKAVARGSRLAIVSHCLEDAVVKKHIISKVGKLVQTEIATLCSNRCTSVLRRHSKEDLLSFKWDDVHKEMQEYAPTLLSLLQSATHTRRPRPNQEAVVAMCTAMMCKLRRPDMSIAHKTLSLILYAGHASKKVFVRLHKLGLTMSYISTIRLLEKLGENHDAEAHKWRKCLLEHLEASKTGENNSGSAPEMSTYALPEEIDSNGSAAGNCSEMEGATDDSSSVLTSDASQGDDIDISFTSTCEADSPQASHQDGSFTIRTSRTLSLSQSTLLQLSQSPGSSLDFSPASPKHCTVAPQFSPIGPRHSDTPVGPHLSPATLHHSPIRPHHSVITPHHSPVAPQLDCQQSPIGQEPTPLGNSDQTQPQPEPTYDTVSSTCVTPSLYGMKICGDNIDWSIHPRYIRSDQQTQSVHYFHSYAIKDRVDISTLSDVPPQNLPSTSEVLSKLIPSAHEESIIHDNFAVLLGRMLCSNLKFFKETFADILDWHIPHKYSKEMSKKSEVVPLGLLMKNENKHSEMIDIMSHLHQYVPLVQGATGIDLDEDRNFPCRETVHPLVFMGDQLTAARARSCQELRINSDTTTGRLNGLVPMPEDWHTLVTLLVVIWKRLYNPQSSTDFGTLYQLRNLINRRNVIAHPEKDVHASEDFLKLVVTAHFLVACMKRLGMESLDDVPTSGDFDANTWMMSDADRRTALYSFCQEVISDHVNISMCGDITSSEDGVLNYANEVMSLGIFYLNYKDAIQEGDGDRVLLCWKYLLPIFKVSDRRNYSLEALRMLYSYHFSLSPRLKHQLLWSRFVNVHGLPGRNIAGDLHMEHLNHVCKQAIQGIGAKKRKEALTRIGKAVGPLASVTSNFDENVLKPTNKHLAGQHKRASVFKDQQIIINELLNHAHVFSETPTRSHCHFKVFSTKASIFMKVNNKTFEKWIEDNIPK